MMMWVIFLMIAWRINVFLLFLHADGNILFCTRISLITQILFAAVRSRFLNTRFAVGPLTEGK